MNRLPNKIALITGGTQSIGKTIAELFQQHGARVIISGSRPAEEGAKIAKDIHADMIYLKLDVTLESDWENAMRLIQQKYGRLDILVNNAGIEQPIASNRPQDPEQCSLEDWHRVHQVNLDGVFLGCKHAISLMKRHGHASIINMGSRSGLTGVPSSAAYSSSKAAVRNHTKTVAQYCAAKQYAIRCNTIHPAAILTKMWEKEFGTDELREQRITQFSKSIPLRHMGTPEDVAYAALYLASDESRFMTGAEILLDGGIMSGSAAAANATVLPVYPQKAE